jgi:hypothetical protein
MWVSDLEILQAVVEERKAKGMPGGNTLNVGKAAVLVKTLALDVSFLAKYNPHIFTLIFVSGVVEEWMRRQADKIKELRTYLRCQNH